VLRKGGTLLAGFLNPALYVFDLDLADSTGELRVEYHLPYADPRSLSEEGLRRKIEGESRWSLATPWRIRSAAR
jgi:hypothetical protein